MRQADVLAHPRHPPLGTPGPPRTDMWLLGVGLVLAGLLVGTGGMHLIRTSELKKLSGHVLEGH